MPNYNLEVSEKYTKYICRMIYDNSCYYFFSGIDLTDTSEPNRLLLTNKKKIAIHSNINKLLVSIFSDDSLVRFDENNIKNWLKNIQFPIRPYWTCNFDLLNEQINIHDKKQITNVINIINLIDDYAFQINNKSFIKDVTAKPIIMLRDYDIQFSIFRGQSPYEHIGVNEIPEQKLQLAISRLNKRLASCFQIIDNSI